MDNNIIGQEPSNENTTEATIEKKYKCRNCSESFDTKTDLMTHYRVSHPKAKQTTDTLEPLDVVETDKRKSSQKAVDILPENLAFLKNKMKAYGVKGVDNIITGMETDPTNLKELETMLRANGNQNSVPYVLAIYSNLIGQPLPSAQEGSTTQKPLSEIDKALNDTMTERIQKARLAQLERDAYGSGNQNHNPETESIKLQLAKLEEHNRQLQDMLLRQKQEDELKSLREELKQVKEQSGGQISEVANSMKDFSTSIVHLLDKKEMESGYEKQISSLREELRLARPTTQTAENLRELRGMASDIGAGIAGSMANLSKNVSTSEKGILAMHLLDRGMSPEQIENILGSQAPGLNLRGSSKQEAENLKVVEAMRKANEKPLDWKPSDDAIKFPPKKEPAEQPSNNPDAIKFITNDGE